MERSEKGFVPAILLCFFLGQLGIHRFYVGKSGTGILMLFTLGGLGIWTIIDFITIVCGSFKDNVGLPVKAS
jgi:TM2 domain-containing membrane protein YozV